MRVLPFHFYDSFPLDDGEIYLRLLETAPPQPEKGFVPTYRFSIVRRADDEAVGRCDLRVGFNESLFYAGNIGYRIFDPFRGNHYALKACRLLLELAKKHRMPQVVITCRPDNLPSRRTCEALGAQLGGIVTLPLGHELYRAGDRQECRYILNFDEFR